MADAPKAEDEKVVRVRELLGDTTGLIPLDMINRCLDYFDGDVPEAAKRIRDILSEEMD